MHIKIISYSFVKGGAAIAARKFHDILDSRGYIVQKLSQDDAGKWQFFLRLISYALGLLQRKEEPIKHSLNLFSDKRVLTAFNDKNVLHHLHWVNNDTLSVFSFDKIPSRSIITLHDEWLYCGTEHYCHYSPHAELNCYVEYPNLPFAHGYSKSIVNYCGFNWKYIIWNEKYKRIASRNDLLFTVPSTWMLKRAHASLMLKNKDIRVLPNPIDTTIFSPSSNISDVRSKYGLGKSDIVLTFGAVGGNKNKAKGAQSMLDALNILQTLITSELNNRIKLVVFGAKGKEKITTPFSCFEIGHIKDSTKLAEIYAMSDCVIVPSYVESFGQVAAEAQSCGVPVVAFATSGIMDVVIDMKTGLLAEPFSSISLAQKIADVILFCSQKKQEFSSAARQHVLEHFSYDVVAEKYIEILNEVIAKKNYSEEGKK
ncbi:glycosyltransferase [Aeromonas veronii]|uniref:glycosyltransferase n=1 Tax=Aeromonas veronii TaxID=654 RepID=UPI00214D6CEA|nr:glycosyltransferase [Aeromonas veronii]MCR3969141.1 glycosyltransferase [Aeromonas veronii]MCR3981620.1 glycosyltransferase [Aeromonas veronii]